MTLLRGLTVVLMCTALNHLADAAIITATGAPGGISGRRDAPLTPASAEIDGSSAAIAFADNIASDGEIVLTIDGGDIDGDGIATGDSVVVTIGVVATDVNGTIPAGFVFSADGSDSEFTPGIVGGDADTSDDATLAFSLVDVVATGSSAIPLNTDFSFTALDFSAFQGNNGSVRDNFTVTVNSSQTSNVIDNGGGIDLASEFAGVLVESLIINPLVTGSNSDSTFNVDNFDFTVEVTAVPEPATIALFGLSTLSLVVRRRR